MDAKHVGSDRAAVTAGAETAGEAEQRRGRAVRGC